MKFPVFKAFFAGMAYLISHLLTLLKILWLPALLMIAAMVYLMPSMMDAQIQIAQMEKTADPSEAFALMGSSFRSTGLLYLAMAVFYPMMTAGVLKHIVRGDAPRLPFYLQYGGDELRVLFAFILVVIMFILVGVVGFLASFVLSVIAAAVLSAVSSALAGVVSGLVVLALVVVFIWFMLRLSVVFPAAIGARSIGVAESWSLTKGASFALFFYWLFWLIFLMVVLTPIVIFMMGDYFALMREMIVAGTGGDAAAVETLEARMLREVADMWDMSKPGFWPFIAANYVYIMLNLAVWTVAGGVAYRYLSDGR